MILSKSRIVAGSHSWRELRDFYIHLRLRNIDVMRKDKKKKLKVGREFWASSGAVVKNLPANAEDTRDLGSIPGSGRSPGIGNGYPLQYSCLENFLDREAWQALVHGVAKSQTRLIIHTKNI